MKLFVICCSFFILCSPVHAQVNDHKDLNFQADKIFSVLDQIKKRGKFPPIPFAGLCRGGQRWKAPRWLQKVIKEVENSIFDKTGIFQLIERRPALLAVDVTQFKLILSRAHLQEVIEHFGSSFKKPSKKVINLIRFIVAHEISHYLHDLAVLQNGKSPAGFGSYTDGKECSTENSDEADDEIALQQSLAAMQTHAEIDAFAFAILEQHGFPFPQLLSEFNHRFYRPEPSQDPELPDFYQKMDKTILYGFQQRQRQVRIWRARR